MLRSRFYATTIVSLVILIAPGFATSAEKAVKRTALDEYVQKADPAYKWEVVKKIDGEGFTTFVVDLKSQTWRTPEDVDRTLWQHWLVICKPDNVASNKAFMYIGGGSNGGDPPNATPELLSGMALATNSVIAQIGMIPNQPLEFHGDGKGRKEDNLIGYAWVKFLETGDPTWAPRLPMVKSVVRGMDTVEALLASDEGGNVTVNEWVVAGGSKRGWTTWLTGVADDRVVAIVPIVIDILNVEKSMRHHFAAYGFWAPAIGDYVHHKLVYKLGTPENKALMDLVDPYAYLDRLTMPKFIVNSTGDQFFLPDSSKFYFDDLQGEKNLRYVANGEHSLRGTDARESILAFYHAIVNDTPRPEFTWEFAEDGSIQVESKTTPQKVVLWQATNPEARDFRTTTIGRAYTATDLESQGDGRYVARVDRPANGFTAFFVELSYDVGAPTPLKFTSGVRVTPDTLPYADKDPTIPVGGE